MQPVIIKHRNVRLEQKQVECHSRKTVELLEDQGVVRAIQLRCSCGEITVLELEYGTSQPEPTRRSE